jgi:carboxylesterase
MTLIPTAEPFFFPGGPTGCLLIHGFTGTPKEMRWLGEYLAGCGHTVLGIRLAGHATRPEDLPRTRWQDWLHSVEDGWHLLKDSTQTVFVMGLSMGGSLALLLASRCFTPSTPVAGVVAMSTPYALPDDPRLPYARLLAKIKPEVPKGPPDWRNLEAGRDHIDYPNYPTLGIAEMRDLLAEMRRVLPLVQAPTLLIHSRADEGVLPVNMQRIFDHLGSQDKQMLWVENSGHVVVREPERERIFEAIEEFISRVNSRQALETR